ncbi:poly(ADP-ribose) glycohydrolase-like [Actinia tenebrosa]|uniref:poly(ADP-ribose) glycohydrolase n=1 Tax=Actinia tenebrosa TaxID=6105 RepID=A0A6P8J4H9_ACTTE|nr:poly(ADP-ribose) glycohydrolase-like [Actinia tenebrosa]
MNLSSAEERKRKRVKQCSIEESFKRHRIQDNYDLGRAKSTSRFSPEMASEVPKSEDIDSEAALRRNVLAQAAEKRLLQSFSSVTSPVPVSEGSGSDVAVEAGGSRDALSESEGDVATIEFDSFPESPPLPEEYECCSNESESKIVSGGVPLCMLNRTPGCCAPMPPLMPQPDHTVLIRVSKNGDIAQPPKPSYSTYRDKWDKDHVRMPCSIENLYPIQNSSKKVQNRWELIESTLLSPIKSSYDLQDAILKYNARYSSRWNFEALHSYFNEVLDGNERNEFFNQTLPAMVRLTLQLPEVCTQAIPLMKQGKNHSITTSQHQAASLLANAFFCTFPRRNSHKHSEYSSFPDINFNRLFQGGKGGTSTVKSEKLKAVLHYFKSVTQSMPTGAITFQRQAIPIDAFPRWDKCTSTFTRLHVSTSGTIEDDGTGFLQVDFANKYIGGGVIGEGCVQEEIRFLICPEMILSRLICEKIDSNESVIITGAQRFSNYTGYAHTFKWAGNHNDQMPRDSWGRRHSQVVAIDAQVFHSYTDQFRTGFLKRELDKAFGGFFSTEDSKYLPAIATGNWGCGAFGGDSRLKAIIQMMSAAAAQRDIVYFTFGDSELAEDLLNIQSFIKEKGITIGDMWMILCKYGKEINAASSVKIKLYDYIYRLYQCYESDTDPESEEPIPLSTSSSDVSNNNPIEGSECNDPTM